MRIRDEGDSRRPPQEVEAGRSTKERPLPPKPEPLEGSEADQGARPAGRAEDTPSLEIGLLTWLPGSSHGSDGPEPDT